jgi:hypothetical protein
MRGTLFAASASFAVHWNPQQPKLGWLLFGRKQRWARKWRPSCPAILGRGARPLSNRCREPWSKVWLHYRQWHCQIYSQDIEESMAYAILGPMPLTFRTCRNTDFSWEGMKPLRSWASSRTIMSSLKRYLFPDGRKIVESRHRDIDFVAQCRRTLRSTSGGRRVELQTNVATASA